MRVQQPITVAARICTSLHDMAISNSSLLSWAFIMRATIVVASVLRRTVAGLELPSITQPPLKYGLPCSTIRHRRAHRAGMPLNYLQSQTHHGRVPTRRNLKSDVPKFSFTRELSSEVINNTMQSKKLRRVRTMDVSSPSDEIIIVKGWVRTVRKQKSLAFVQINDGSTMRGIQCVLPFDSLDDQSMKGTSVSP